MPSSFVDDNESYSILGMGDGGEVSARTYDELVRLHSLMTARLSGLTAEGLVEFRVNRLRGVIEVLVDRQYDPHDLDDLVAGIPPDAYEVLQTADREATPTSSRGALIWRRLRRLIGGNG